MAEPEYDPYSPAGTVERFGEFSRGLSRRRWGKLAAWAAIGLLVAVPLISWLVVLLVNHH
jgi:cell division protein FtsX